MRNGAGQPEGPADVPAEPARKEGGEGPAHSSQGMRKYRQHRDPCDEPECVMLACLPPPSHPQHCSQQPGSGWTLVGCSLCPATTAQEGCSLAAPPASWQRGGSSSSVQDPAGL